LGRPDHRADLDQHPVTGGLDDPSAMLSDERIGSQSMLANRRVLPFDLYERGAPPRCRWFASGSNYMGARRAA
jgi:hypothetical protein